MGYELREKKLTKVVGESNGMYFHFHRNMYVCPVQDNMMLVCHRNLNPLDRMRPLCPSSLGATHTARGGQTDIQTDRQTDTQTNRQTETMTRGRFASGL